MIQFWVIHCLICVLSFLGSGSLAASISTVYAPVVDAVIFDCDGVLVDTEYLKFLAWQDALSNIGIDFSIEEYMPMVGHSSENILRRLQQEKQVAIPEEVIAWKNRKYKALQKSGVTPIERMVDFARSLANAKQVLGVVLGLASSAPREEILQNLRQIGLEQAFDMIISGSDDLDRYVDPEGKNKPKPYIYIEAAKRLKAEPSHCLVFEDTQAGVEAATLAGMIAIAVPNKFTFQQDFSLASHVIIDSGEPLSMEAFIKRPSREG